MSKTRDDVLEFWNSRAKLDHLAGSNDFVAKQLELTALSRHVSDGMRILEMGCGNGLTALYLAERFNVSIEAYDFSPEMIKAATEIARTRRLKGSVRFSVRDIQDQNLQTSGFDVAYTERVLINLPDWKTQTRAIQTLIQSLRSGGRYLMCENSQEGLDEINALRMQCGLTEIVPPWHNRYLRESEVASLDVPGAQLMNIEHFSSSYYFISRVVNAWLAKQQGQEPSYDAPINQLGLLVSPIGKMGQGKLWIWERLQQ